MSLSFLGLPPEIRVKIYRILLGDNSDDVANVIDPAPSVVGPISECKEGVCDLLPLLRTCKMVKSEASATLYGRTVFSFTDESLHKDRIGHCGITWMYTFLKLIGPMNRMHLRVIYIEISEFRYCYYTDEVIPGKVAEKNGGSYLGDAFELLSQCHFLQSIVFILDHRRSSAMETTSSLASHLFRPVKESKLLRQLQKIKGLESFECLQDKPGNGDALREFSKVSMTQKSEAIYQQVQMELTEPDIPKQKIASSKKTDKHGTEIMMQGVKPFEHRTELQKKIDAATAQVQEWKALRSRIEETTQQIQQWEEAKLLMDDEIENFQRFSAATTLRVEPGDSTIPSE